MALTEKQRELDELKWNKSNEIGQDACGTFDYCAYCNKSLENPCDLAYSKLGSVAEVKVAKKSTAEKTTKKSTAKKTTKKTTKKPTTKKTTAKKTTKK